MKRQLVIECDSDYSSLFVYEVDRTISPTGKYIYSREVGAEAIVQDYKTPHFYGMLDTLLFTRDTLKFAADLAPEVIPAKTEV